MQADLLDLLTRALGVGVAVLGAAIGAPGGLARFRAGAGRHLRSARAWLRALMRRPQRSVEGHVGSAVAVAPAATASAYGWNWEPSAPVEDKLERLRARTEALSQRLNDVAEKSRRADAKLRASLDDLASRVTSETARIDAELEDMRARDALAQAWSLPLVALGVALTALSPEISGHGLLVWLACMAGVVVLALLWWWVAAHDRQP